MLQTDSLEPATRQELARVGTCTFDELSERLPSYSWNEVFAEVAQLRLEGTVTLQRTRSSDYLLSLAPRQSAEARLVLIRSSTTPV